MKGFLPHSLSETGYISYCIARVPDIVARSLFGIFTKDAQVVYRREEFDYVRMFDHAAAKKLTKDQKVLLGFFNSPARDIEELYKVVKGDADMSDTDPYRYMDSRV